jgi:NADH-quinone oxidoreductase subunit I
LLGEGILKGLKETARNALGSYVSKERLTTVEYPEERLPLPEASRNFPFLVYDGKDWESGLRCVACQICEKECPPKCIYIEKSKDKKPDAVGKAQFYPAKFDIDISVCMSCQICVEVCPFEAIKMNTEFELSTDNRFGGLLLDRKELALSNEYYHQIHPTEASEVDGRLAAERAAAEAKAKAAAAAAAAKAAAPPAAKPAAPAINPAAAPANTSAVPASEIPSGPTAKNPTGTPTSAATAPPAVQNNVINADAPRAPKTDGAKPDAPSAISKKEGDAS